jgi:hypothetical protein
MERMKESTSPLFTDITWGAGGSTADLSLELALHMHNNGHVANMHLTCTNMDESIIRDALQKCLDGGIRNIVALRGDPPEGQDEWKATEGGFTCALDLVRYMRAEFGDAFGIAVAGYPEGHPNAITDLKPEEVEGMTESEKKRCSVINGVTAVCRDEDYKKEMDYLKEKVDAGAGKFGDVYVLHAYRVFRCRGHVGANYLEATLSGQAFAIYFNPHTLPLLLYFQQMLSSRKCSLILKCSSIGSRIAVLGASTAPSSPDSCASMPTQDSRRWSAFARLGYLRLWRRRWSR